MDKPSIAQKIKEFLIKGIFNEKWRCLVCGKELFEKSAFCAECEKSLPFNDDKICNHCGRKLAQSAEYCTTCKGKIVEVDKCRSVFDYVEPIRRLIHKSKYYGEKYLLKIFSEYMALTYLKNYFNADFLTFVPMTKKAVKRRGYNQSKLLAENLSQLINVPVFYDIEKVKDTESQANLDKSDRLKNLTDAFRIKKYKNIKGKKILIVDDVSTTGATARAIATKLKNRGADKVFLLTVASVAPKEKY